MIRYVVIVTKFVVDVCNVVFKIQAPVTSGAHILLRAVLGWVLYKHEQNQWPGLLKFKTKSYSSY